MTVIFGGRVLHVDLDEGLRLVVLVAGLENPDVDSLCTEVVRSVLGQDDAERPLALVAETIAGTAEVAEEEADVLEGDLC